MSKQKLGVASFVQFSVNENVRKYCLMSGNGLEILAFEICYTWGALCGNINHCSPNSMHKNDRKVLDYSINMGFLNFVCNYMY